MQNGFVESFNGRPRDECHNKHLFANLKKERQIIEEWRIDCNTNRPQSSLNGLTPGGKTPQSLKQYRRRVNST